MEKNQHSVDDEPVPIAHSEYLAAKIPSATLQKFQRTSHYTTMFVAIKDVLDTQETIKK